MHSRSICIGTYGIHQENQGQSVVRHFHCQHQVSSPRNAFDELVMRTGRREGW